MNLTRIGVVVMNDMRENVNTANERQLREIAKRWAATIATRLPIDSGTKVEVIVGTETIKSIKTARKIGEELAVAGCKQLVIIYHVWNFPFLIWPLLESLGTNAPVIEIANNDGKWSGNVGLLATNGALRQVGLKTAKVIGSVEDEQTQQSVIQWLRAAVTFTSLRGHVLALYGGHSMGMETGYFHLIPTIKTMGVTAFPTDQLWLQHIMQDVSEAEVTQGRQWFEELLGTRLHYDGDSLTPTTLDMQIKLYLAIMSDITVNGYDFCGLKGQREFSELVVDTDVTEMLLNDPYDWRGPKEPIVCGTEADANGALTMQILKYISGGLPTLFMDVRMYYNDLDLWDFCNSGQHASWYAKQSNNPQDNFSVIDFYPTLSRYFPAGGASVSFVAKPSVITFARLGITDNQFYMVIAEGSSVELDRELELSLMQRTDPTWPHVFSRFPCSYSSMIDNLPANHIHGVAGSWTQELIHFCYWAGIEARVLT